ncbi:alpha/beta hydrolase family protein [Salidesulfovibrio onnuriiensis]|uniref:alpha/beta hydrolase family protein n=1 Tax=Salidesulfovibrio onnuriiensis TaxID=2583823 RepID=UPI00164FFA9E|nr:alpha/beta hydrolase [Salidesulfovibrio onnuriiensis]
MEFRARFRMILPAVLVLLLCLAQAAVADEAEKDFDAHGMSFSYRFKDSDMDFHFGNLVLGAAVNHGVGIGEAFYAASRIEDGDAAGWHEQWCGLARRVEARGEKALSGGHEVSAREQFLRAAYYYRISLLGMLPDNPELLRRGRRCRTLMKKAGQLFDPPVEYIEIPFEGTVLPGYFRPALADGGPRKTLLMIGGGETFAEDLYFYIARQAFERGYNFMTVDLPGQGLLPAEGKVFRTDTYVPMKAVADYALGRQEVDPERFAAYGISGGGLFVPQAAQHDPRIRAIAMNSAVVDAHPIFAAMPVAGADESEMASWTSFHANVVRSICWRYGVDTPAGLVGANRGNTFDPHQVGVPALIIVGENDYASDEVKRQQALAMEGFPNPRKKMVVTPADEGATNHCVMENRALVGQVLFDWLDGVFR